MATREQVWEVLKQVMFPGFDRSVLGAVQGLEIEGGEVTISLAINHLGKGPQQTIGEAVRAAVGALEGVETVHVLATQRAMPAPAAPTEQRRAHLPGIRHVIAVGSGKGGVGKSTVAVNLALALAQQGLRVGLMDADIFGPNVPRMMGVTELPPSGESGMIQPAEAHGLKVMSVGFMVGTEQAVLWRGPMTDKLLRQFLQNVAWGELDALVVDLPPGTGDIALSLSKHAQPDGAIAVVTPQGVAADDARKAISMFRRLEIPVLGVVENMSYFECDACGTRHTLFGEGGGQALADEMGVPLLGQIPFEPLVRAGGDDGQPVALRTDSPAAAAFHAIAAQVRDMVGE